MNCQFEILFYLDNAEVSLIEVAILKDYGFTDAPAMAWFVLYKRKNNIFRFKFESYFSKPKTKGRPIEKGILRISRSTGCYTISIGASLFEFCERPVKNLPIQEKILLDAYLKRATG